MMIVHEHVLAKFPTLTAEDIPGFGLAVVGRVRPHDKSFAVAALKYNCTPFESYGEAEEALVEVRARRDELKKIRRATKCHTGAATSVGRGDGVAGKG